MDASGWNERYAASTVWSGEPNAALVATVSGMRPAAPDPTAHSAGNATPTALDLGCGEGADALWLAAHGWDVTGVDWSDVALERARAATRDAGLGARFVQGDATDPDFLAGLSPTRTFDLITLAFIHPEPEERDSTYAPLPGLVAPGGHLLVIAHDPAHGDHGHPGPAPARLMSPVDILKALHLPADFEVLVDEVRSREQDGEVVAVDSVVLVRRAR
jgi:SAM-dependent methyltransferase